MQANRCSQCGAPLEIVPGDAVLTCPYCRSMLRVAQDGSGQLTAILDSIYDDTDIVARRAAVAHLCGRLLVLNRQQTELRSLMQQECVAATSADKGPQEPSPPAGKEAYARFSCLSLILIMIGAVFLPFGIPAFLVSLQTRLELSENASAILTGTDLLAGFGVLALFLNWVEHRHDAMTELRHHQRKNDLSNWAKERTRWQEGILTSVKLKYAPQLTEVETQIDSTRARIAELEAQIDHLARVL